MTHFFVEKPFVFVSIQWNGNNFAEVEAWAEEHAPWALPMSEDSGTININNGNPLSSSDWLTNVGSMTVDQMSRFQEVSAADVTYDTTVVVEE